MKRFSIALFFLAISVAMFFLFLNCEVSTQQGIDYQYSTIKIPLYLKVLDFFDRHYNYQQLVKNIINNEDGKKERVMKIFEWTQQNIRRQPSELPVVDDHVWHIIVRGYGVDDQFNDVFTTLCNYARVEAFFTFVWSKDNTRRTPFSFVKLKDKWCIFDPYFGVYFQDGNGDLAEVDIVRRGDYVLNKIVERDYSIYVNNFPAPDKIGLARANTQSPLNRLFLELKKVIK